MKYAKCTMYYVLRIMYYVLWTIYYVLRTTYHVLCKCHSYFVTNSFKHVFSKQAQSLKVCPISFASAVLNSIRWLFTICLAHLFLCSPNSTFVFWIHWRAQRTVKGLWKLREIHECTIYPVDKEKRNYD